VHPTSASFVRQAECRLLLVPRGTVPPRSLAARADRIVAVDPHDEAAVAEPLELVG
jgi:hypothetical protein